MQAYRRSAGNWHSLSDRCDFWLRYLDEVVPLPNEVSVHHVPNSLQPYDLRGDMYHGRSYQREEIDIQRDGGIFMTGVVFMEQNHYPAEELAGTLAYNHWSQGYFFPDRNYAWRSFTCSDFLIRFYKSRDGREWVRTDTFHPINHVEEVAAYLYREYEGVRRR